MPGEIKVETPVIDKGGNESDSKPWLTSVPSELRGHEVFKGIDKPEGVYQTLIDLSEKSKGAIKIPGDGASEDDIKAYRQALGIPDSPDGYEIERPKLPNGIPYDEGREAEFKTIAHSLNLSTEQVKGLLKWESDAGIKAHEELQKMGEQVRKDTEALLIKEWGGQTKFDENLNLAKRAARNIGGEEFVKWMDESGAGNDPAMIKFMHKFATLVDNDKLEGKSNPTGVNNEREKDRAGQPLLSFPSMKPK